MNDDAPDVLPCADKLGFDTAEAARATATVSEYRYGSQLKVYRCRHCQLFHLSSNYDG